MESSAVHSRTSLLLSKRYSDFIISESSTMRPDNYLFGVIRFCNHWRCWVPLAASPHWRYYYSLPLWFLNCFWAVLLCFKQAHLLERYFAKNFTTPSCRTGIHGDDQVLRQIFDRIAPYRKLESLKISGGEGSVVSLLLLLKSQPPIKLKIFWISLYYQLGITQTTLRCESLWMNRFQTCLAAFSLLSLVAF